MGRGAYQSSVTGFLSRTSSDCSRLFSIDWRHPTNLLLGFNICMTLSSATLLILWPEFLLNESQKALGLPPIFWNHLGSCNLIVASSLIATLLKNDPEHTQRTSRMIVLPLAFAAWTDLLIGTGQAWFHALITLLHAFSGFSYCCTKGTLGAFLIPSDLARLTTVEWRRPDNIFLGFTVISGLGTAMITVTQPEMFLDAMPAWQKLGITPLGVQMLGMAVMVFTMNACAILMENDNVHKQRLFRMLMMPIALTTVDHWRLDDGSYGLNASLALLHCFFGFFHLAARTKAGVDAEDSKKI